MKDPLEKMKRCPVIVVLLAVLPMTALGQAVPSDPSPCASAEARAFDFWIGDWEIEARDRPPGAEHWTKNETWFRTRVRSDLSGCVVIEESIDKVGADTLVVGLSMTSYNVHLGRYQQMWIDRQGNTLEYVGGREGERMVLYLEPTASSGEPLVPFQKTTQLRMVFDEITEDRLVWRYQYSTDEGNTWTSTNEAVYRRGAPLHRLDRP